MSIDGEGTDDVFRAPAEAQRDGADGRHVRVGRRVGGGRAGRTEGRQACASRGQKCTTAPCCAGLACSGGTCALAQAPGVTYVTGPAGSAGPQGVVGPQGPTGRASMAAGPVGGIGPLGPEGPAGPSQFGGGIACTKVISETVIASDPLSTTEWRGDWEHEGPVCPAGTRLFYCGIKFPELKASVESAYQAYVVPPGCVYAGTLYGPTGTTAEITFYAVCAGDDSYCNA